MWLKCITGKNVLFKTGVGELDWWLRLRGGGGGDTFNSLGVSKGHNPALLLHNMSIN